MALAERLIEQAELALSELHLSPTSLDVLWRYIFREETRAASYIVYFRRRRGK
jgi:hypothetical protein